MSDLSIFIKFGKKNSQDQKKTKTERRIISSGVLIVNSKGAANYSQFIKLILNKNTMGSELIIVLLFVISDS